MTRDELVAELENKKLTEVIDLIEEAEAGYLTELELAPSLGLLRDDTLNEAVLNYLSSQGVEIIYVTEDEE
ncbi:hypothetical protein CR203_09285 [Salipaludibacillus neizhouensis]|uniref:RNA polymerase sigma factor 70 region 1.1 domain-containing protein n=1 Tax=Salipaludibacillus neizhouensis TaxID=885475 RepID=A0A3A9KAF5_9BACI|nr:hypothetical protein [Salipaludibacillus neizhouensis]RKL67532.1 hypothetical protein CR203_09285 [Salipaludibacillus neizhouensis]